MAFQSNLTRFAASCLALLACMPAPAATTAELLRLTDRLDQMDKLDFDQAVEKAEKCIRLRDFSCTETQLKSARKLVTGTSSKTALGQAETNLALEKEAVESEKRAIAQRERELQEQEARLRQAEERAQQQAARDTEGAEGMSTAQGVALFGSLLGQSLANQSVQRMAEMANARRFEQQRASVNASIARDQERFARERAQSDAQRARTQQQLDTRQRDQPAQRANPQQLAAQREAQDAAATKRTQIVERLEADRRAEESQARANVRLAQETRQPEAKAKLGCLPFGAIGDRASISPDCSKDRNNTFGWGNSQAAACEGAQRSVRQEFDARNKNPSGCYCKADAKVNSVVEPFVCWVIFDY